MPVPPLIQELVQRFERNRSAYHAGQYNEAQVRQEFINPFWEALGWDVYNRQGYSEKHKEVVHEDAIQVQGKSRAPDYAFYRPRPRRPGGCCNSRSRSPTGRTTPWSTSCTG